MSNFCFFPARRAVIVFSLIRLILSKVGIAWILFTSPESLVFGPIVHLVTSFLPESTNLNLIVPALSAELVVDTVLLAGLLRNQMFCLLPWLIFNIMLVLGLGAGVMSLLSSIIVLPLNVETETPTEMEAALDDIKNFLMVIILNVFLVLEMVNVSAAMQVFAEMKKDRDNKPASENDACMDSDQTEAEDANSDLNLLENEEIPKVAVDQDLNNSFDSFLYEDVP